MKPEVERGPYRKGAAPQRPHERRPKPIPRAFVFAWVLLVGQALRLLVSGGDSGGLAWLAVALLALAFVVFAAEVKRG